jgi:dihydropyrimidinase
LDTFDGRSSDYLKGMRLVGEPGMLSVVHCEDGRIIRQITERPMTSGSTGPEHYPAIRPVFFGKVAVTRAVEFPDETGAPVYVVHLPSAAPWRMPPGASP